MTELYVLRPEQRTRWMDVLAQSFQHDFYHLPAYHALAEERGEGQAYLFLCTEGDHFVAVPLLLRSIGTEPGLERLGEGWWDATCVYGYAGPVASHTNIPDAVLQRFRIALRKALFERRIVSAFSRLHPLIPQRGFLAGLGECTFIGQTVSVDLTLPVDVQRAQYRKNHKRDINKLRRLGATWLHDQNKIYLDEFVEIYHDTMQRVGASDVYLFEKAYFERLLSTSESQFHLFLCLMEKEVICGGLFALCDGIVQYHLGGTRSSFLELSPMKLLFDTVRLWANEQQARVFHLGGGTGVQEDTLFHFKAGFSDQRHAFATWGWVLLPDVYDQLCQAKVREDGGKALGLSSAEFFPAYRYPVASAQGRSE